MRRILKRCCIILIIVCGMFLSGCEKPKEDGFQEISLEELDEEGTSGEERDNGNLEQEGIYVHVCGEVQCPGVYELNNGSRIFEAIEKAGGMTEKAAAESVNQAGILEDGQQLYIPSEEELLNQKKDAATMEQGKVDINKASREELMTLSGIGESRAADIIKYREENGDFSRIEDIMLVSGIGEKTFEEIKEQITVGE